MSLKAKQKYCSVTQGFLFDVEKKSRFISSPLNYTGGKYKLLPQIIPYLSDVKGKFLDLFCGGCNVGINIDCPQVFFNDINFPLYKLFVTFQTLGTRKLLELIDEIIDEYKLSRSNRYGYAYYGCESSKGLGDYNRPAFLRLRNDLNKMEERNDIYYIMLYVIIVYAFNNQIRFNNEGKFNLPVGKRDFNNKMELKLSSFVNRLQSSNYTFMCSDFRKVDLDNFTSDDLIYVDPPYLITCATYNEQNGWNDDYERVLYAYLDRAHEKGLRFALSNVLTSKGKRNHILLNWLANNTQYRVCPLNYGYSNANYQKHCKENDAREVLIVNY